MEIQIDIPKKVTEPSNTNKADLELVSQAITSVLYDLKSTVTISVIVISEVAGSDDLQFDELLFSQVDPEITAELLATYTNRKITTKEE